MSRSELRSHPLPADEVYEEYLHRVHHPELLPPAAQIRVCQTVQEPLDQLQPIYEVIDSEQHKDQPRRAVTVLALIRYFEGRRSRTHPVALGARRVHF